MGRLTYMKRSSRQDVGKHPTKYTSRHTFQEVVARLAAYGNTGVEPEEIKDVQEALKPIPFGRFRDIMEAERTGRLVVLQPNDPLTLEELREMDGIPVFVTKNGESVGYALVNSPCSIVYITCSTGSKWYAEDLIDEGCKFYRRKPEESAHE